MVIGIEPRGTPGADIHRQTLGETRLQFYRVDGAFGAQHHSTGKQLIGLIAPSLLGRPVSECMQKFGNLPT